MKQMRVLIVMLVVGLWPATAHAARGWWGWLEELSGPGFFDGYVFSTEVRCWKKDGSHIPCSPFGKKGLTNDRKERFARYFEISAGALTSRDRPRFKDLVTSLKDTPANHRSVWVVPVSGAYMFRLHRSIDLGSGAGVLVFAGKDVEAHARLVLIPVTGSWKFLLTKDGWPNTWLSRAIGLDFHVNYITKGFTGRDFGDTVTTFKSVPEFKVLAGISVDLSR